MLGEHAADASPIECALAHRAGDCGGIDIALREVAGAEPARGVTHSEQFRMRGRIALQHDVVPALADDHTIAHHHGAIGLIALAHRLVAQCARPREERGPGRLGGLTSGGIACCAAAASNAREGRKGQRGQQTTSVLVMSHGEPLLSTDATSATSATAARSQGSETRSGSPAAAGR